MSIIYLDMDGVLADFFGGIQKFYGVDHWKMLKEDQILGVKGTDFFYKLDPFESAHKLVEHVKTVAWQNEMRLDFFPYGLLWSPSPLKPSVSIKERLFAFFSLWRLIAILASLSSSLIGTAGLIGPKIRMKTSYKIGH